jgi:hypothetical protein
LSDAADFVPDDSHDFEPEPRQTRTLPLTDEQRKRIERGTSAGTVKPPSFLDNLGDALKVGVRSAGADFNENFAFGMPAKIMDAVGVDSPEARARARAEADESMSGTAAKTFHDIIQPGRVAGLAASGVAGPEAGIAKSVQAAGTAARSAAPVLTTSRAGRMLAATGEGALTGAGISAADTAARGGSIKDVGESALEGGALGSLVGGGVQGAGEVKNAVLDRTARSLRGRILHEVAEGSEGKAPVAKTVRKHVEMAGDNIVKEATTGPDADAVRKAWLNPDPKVGKQEIGKVIKKVGAERTQAYDTVEHGGFDAVSLGNYLRQSEHLVADATKAGQSKFAEAVEEFTDKVISEARKTNPQSTLTAPQMRTFLRQAEQFRAAGNVKAAEAVEKQLESQAGSIGLRQLRGLTTEAQAHAKAALGGIEENLRWLTGRRLTAAVTDMMDESMTQATHGAPPEVRSAVDKIREVNPRFNALLTAEEAIGKRAAPIETGKFGLRKVVDTVMHGAGPMVGGALGLGHGHAGAGALAGAAAQYVLPRAASAIDRGITSAAIRRVRSGALPASPDVTKPVQGAATLRDLVRDLFGEKRQ